MCLGKKTGSKKKSTVIHVPWEKNRELKKINGNQTGAHELFMDILST
jgi:hypothetical protein